MVLIFSTAVDSATDVVCGILSSRGVEYRRLNTETYPYMSSVSVSPSTGLHLDGERLEPTAVWYRRFRSPMVPNDMEQTVHEYCVREAHSLIRGLTMTSACPVMSPPEAVFGAENKVNQLYAAMNLGLTIPETLITNSPAEAQRFCEATVDVICKPLRRGWFESRGSDWSIYTTRVDEELIQNIGNVQSAPVIFQEEVPKMEEYRVTIVGRSVFVAAIESQVDPDARVDWRQTTNPNLPHREAELPQHIVSKLLGLMDTLGLQFGAIDLIKTPEDRFVFLEVNPNGQWLWLDDMLDLGISNAVAEWLTSSSCQQIAT